MRYAQEYSSGFHDIKLLNKSNCCHIIQSNPLLECRHHLSHNYNGKDSPKQKKGKQAARKSCTKIVLIKSSSKRQKRVSHKLHDGQFNVRDRRKFISESPMQCRICLLFDNNQHRQKKKIVTR